MTLYDSSKDYYSILGADEDASQVEIERLYKRLAVRHHPDRGGDEEEMKSLNEAYSVLGDRAAREAYDADRAGPVVEADFTPYTSPPAQVDLFTGQWVGAILFIAIGLVLALLVRFQWIWFLWPLAILAFFLVVVGLLMAHGAVHRFWGKRDGRPKGLPGALMEVAFWIVVLCGGYGVYLVMR